MKRYFILIILIAIVLSLIVFFFFRNNLFNTPNSSNTSATKLSTNINTTTENITANTSNKVQRKEEELATFSTEIRDDSPGRVTNISITCSALNNTIVKKGEEFSFNEIVGKPSRDKGYEEATVIIDGEHEKGIGGRKLSS